MSHRSRRPDKCRRTLRIAPPRRLAGEGAPYTGLKPAGLGFGPVVPVAERAIDSGSPDELVAMLTEKVRHEVLGRFGRAMERKPHADESVESARAYVEASLGLQVWSHELYACASAGPHEEHGEAHEHGEAEHEDLRPAAAHRHDD